MATTLPKYQSPKRKRASSGNITKKPHMDLQFKVSSDQFLEDKVSADCDLDGVRKSSDSRIVFIENSKSGNTTMADQSSNMSEVNTSTGPENSSVFCLSLNSTLSGISGSIKKDGASGSKNLSRSSSPVDMVAFYDHTSLQKLRSPYKSDRPIRSISLLDPPDSSAKSSYRLREENILQTSHHSSQFVPPTTTYTTIHIEGSGGKWRNNKFDDDASDDETGNIQMALHFSDADSESEVTVRDDTEQDSFSENNCVAGQMSTLNVGKSRRRLSKDLRFIDGELRTGSPDSFADSLLKDSPFSRFSSPDLGYSGTPVMEIESSADLDEALDVSLASNFSGHGKNVPSPQNRAVQMPPPATRNLSTAFHIENITRPVPSNLAFDRRLFSSPSFTKVCPATPLRASYLHATCDEEVMGDASHRNADTAPVAFARQNSLIMNKVLLSQTEINEDTEVSFHRDFEDEGVLGSGQFSTVYLGRAKDGSNRVCAIKKLNSQFRSRKERDFHLNEVRTMESIGKVPCEYIIHFFTAWQEDGHLYVDIEFAANGTIKDLLMNLNSKNQRFLDSTLYCILHDVSQGLKHIHDCGYVHLDIKPANILIASNGVLKIGDFGNAVEIGVDRDGSEGDTRYMAAELLDSNYKETSADIFSFGLTIYELALAPTYAGLPLEGEGWHDLRCDRAPPIIDHSISLSSIVVSMMKQNPSSRISTEVILSIPEVATALSSEDSALLSARPHKPLFSRFSSSLAHINTQLGPADDAGEDEDRAVTPIGGAGSVFKHMLPPIKPFSK